MDATETTLFEAIITASVILGVIIFYFIFMVIRQQRKWMALQKKTALAEIVALEKERARIATDLHDEIGSLIFGVKMWISNLELTGPENLAIVEKVNQIIDQVINQIHQISYSLMPGTLLKHGLIKTITEYIDFQSSSSQIHFFFHPDIDREIAETPSINIYRIIQEVIHNSIKHSNASEVHVEIKNRENKIRLSITDNGIGFDYEKELEQERGMGLGNIGNRAQLMGGKMFLQSSPGKGTQYLFEIPI